MAVQAYVPYSHLPADSDACMQITTISHCRMQSDSLGSGPDRSLGDLQAIAGDGAAMVREGNPRQHGMMGSLGGEAMTSMLSLASSSLLVRPQQDDQNENDEEGDDDSSSDDEDDDDDDKNDSVSSQSVYRSFFQAMEWLENRLQ
jgi:hypothetical protein